MIHRRLPFLAMSLSAFLSATMFGAPAHADDDGDDAVDDTVPSSLPPPESYRPWRYGTYSTPVTFRGFGWRPPRAGEKPKVKKSETHFAAVPMAGGDSDIGIGFGALASLSRDEPYYEPFLYKIDLLGFFAFRIPKNKGPQITYQDYYALVTLPHLLPGKVRLELRPSYTQETTQIYYGLGNAADPVTNFGLDPQTDKEPFFYERTHPRMAINARLSLSQKVFFQWGIAYTHNWIHFKPDSSLARDLQSGTPEVKKLLGDAGVEHGLAHFDYAFVYDSRDSELSPTAGGFHQVKVRLSPGGSKWLPYAYVESSVILRFYQSIASKYLVLAARAVGDVMAGNPPFYELARADDFFALGGANGVRGVPAQRYYGKMKAYGSVELRSELINFKFLGEDTAVGLAAFLDAGRVWSEVSFDAQPQLDGTTPSIKYGVGGGLRLRQGENFLIRGDIAWSPDARPIGGYFAAGEAF